MLSKEIISSISSQRFGTYENLYSEIVPTHNTSVQYRKITFYMSIQEIYAHFFVPVQVLEVTLRNKLHYANSRHYRNRDWFQSLVNEKFCTYGTAKMFNDCERQILKRFSKNNMAYRNPIPEDYVSELNFGFWVELLNSDYRQTLFWQFYAKDVFPNKGGAKISEIYNTLKRIQTIRNRLYHYEPLWKSLRKFNDIDDFCTNLEEQYFIIMKILSYCSLTQETLLEEHTFDFELAIEAFKTDYKY